jgi:hypothetical protein
MKRVFTVMLIAVACIVGSTPTFALGGVRPSLRGDQLIDKGASSQAVCVRSWVSSSSDRGSIDPQPPSLAQAHQ